jgi:hypothetical protein
MRTSDSANLYVIIQGSSPQKMQEWFTAASAAYRKWAGRDAGSKEQADTAMSNCILWLRPAEGITGRRNVLFDYSNFIFGLFRFLRAKIPDAKLDNHVDQHKDALFQFLMDQVPNHGCGWAPGQGPENTRGWVSGRYLRPETWFGHWANEIVTVFDGIPWMNKKFVAAPVRLHAPGNKEFGQDEVLQANGLDTCFLRYDTKWSVTTFVSGDGNDNNSFDAKRPTATSSPPHASSMWTTAQRIVLEQGNRLEVVAWNASINARYREFADALPELVKVQVFDDWHSGTPWIR